MLLIVTNLTRDSDGDVGTWLHVGLGGGDESPDMLGNQKSRTESSGSSTGTAAAAPQEKRVEDYLTVDPMELSIGLGLLSLADPSAWRRFDAANHRRTKHDCSRHRHHVFPRYVCATK